MDLDRLRAIVARVVRLLIENGEADGEDGKDSEELLRLAKELER